MRNTIYVEDGPLFASVAAIVLPGTLVVVEDEKTASAMRALVHVYGQQTMDVLVEWNPLIPANEARNQSVEVRTLAEMDQMDANEKLAMEVL